MSLTQYSYNHSGPFQLEGGAELPKLTIVFHSSVSPSNMAEAIDQGRRVVWICHALTANSDVSDWWSDLVGEGRYFDTNRDIIICANILGSCYGTTGASSWGGRPLDFPRFSVRDLVSAHSLLRSYLGIDSVDLLIGSSVGGYQALEWSIMEADIIKRLILIACNERISPWATAINESQRMAIEADSTFVAQQDTYDGGILGLQAARSVALLSYRSYDGYNITQNEKDDDCFLARRAATYQKYQGEKLSSRFDAYCYYTILSMTDTHNVGRNRGGIEAALSMVKAKSIMVAIGSDILFPPSELQRMSELIDGAVYAEIQSAFGHDGFLIEWRALSAVIDNFLKE
ncbi:MAG: alpha/beta fold hydrolase [Rikenellaceae bacterium]